VSFAGEIRTFCDAQKCNENPLIFPSEMHIFSQFLPKTVPFHPANQGVSRRWFVSTANVRFTAEIHRFPQWPKRATESLELAGETITLRHDFTNCTPIHPRKRLRRAPDSGALGNCVFLQENSDSPSPQNPLRNTTEKAAEPPVPSPETRKGTHFTRELQCILMTSCNFRESCRNCRDTHGRVVPQYRIWALFDRIWTLFN